MDTLEIFEIAGRAWMWRSETGAAGGWHFLTVPAPVAAEIRYAALGRSSRFGSIPVTATIGATRWQTSLFPDKNTGGMLLPLKADVRRREAIDTDAMVTARLEV